MNFRVGKQRFDVGSYDVLETLSFIYEEGEILIVSALYVLDGVSSVWVYNAHDNETGKMPPGIYKI